ncbi:MAG: dephospho-CoA kinase [Coriobacteriia bacterium]|nr:dephospho-CoA kinase [Coriobacteriia bacterium]
MYTIILTGGLGAGKSTAAQHLESRGATVLHADELAHEVLTKGSMTLAEVAAQFGDDVLLADGSLDRASLARVAFASPEATTRLNEIVHPAVYLHTLAALRDLRLAVEPPEIVVLEVPLLVEAPQLVELADSVIAIVAPEAVRVARAVDRGMAETDAKRRIRAQATDAERALLADKVIVNDGSREVLHDALDGFWNRYVAGQGSRH